MLRFPLDLIQLCEIEGRQAISVGITVSVEHCSDLEGTFPVHRRRNNKGRGGGWM